MSAPKVNKLAANFTFGIPSFDISKILFTFVVNHPDWFKQMKTLLKQMKYLRSLMQQSVTACKNQAKLIQQFTLSLLYLLIIHIVALLFFFLFRLVLFTSIDYQFPPDIQNNFLMQATAFIKGLWFDNVIACYILLLPLVILWITALCNYHSKWVFRFISIFFILFWQIVNAYDYRILYGTSADNKKYFVLFCIAYSMRDNV